VKRKKRNTKAKGKKNPKAHNEGRKKRTEVKTARGECKTESVSRTQGETHLLDYHDR